MQTHSQNFPPIIPIPPKDRNWAGIVNTEQRESDQPGAKEMGEDGEWLPIDRDLELWEKKHKTQFKGPALQTETETLSSHDSMSRQSSVSDYSDSDYDYDSDEESVWGNPMTYPTDTGPTVPTPAQLMSIPLPDIHGSFSGGEGVSPSVDELDSFDLDNIFNIDGSLKLDF